MTASLIPLWLVTATIGEHNNVGLTVPAADIIVAGEQAGAMLEDAADTIYSQPYNYQIQSITQLT